MKSTVFPTFASKKANKGVCVFIVIFSFFLPLFFGCGSGMWKFLGYGLNPCHSCEADSKSAEPPWNFGRKLVLMIRYTVNTR